MVSAINPTITGDIREVGAAKITLTSIGTCGVCVGWVSCLAAFVHVVVVMASGGSRRVGISIAKGRQNSHSLECLIHTAD